MAYRMPNDTTSSPSSFFPSDLMNTPVGYTCRIEMYKLGDFPHTPLLICNSHFANAKKKSDENQLLPTDCLIRLHASATLKTDGPFLSSDEGDVLPKDVYKNMHAFKRAMQRCTLSIQPHTCTTLEPMAFSNIIASTYLLHGKPKPRIGIKPSCPVCFYLFEVIVLCSRPS